VKNFVCDRGLMGAIRPHSSKWSTQLQVVQVHLHHHPTLNPLPSPPGLELRAAWHGLPCLQIAAFDLLESLRGQAIPHLSVGSDSVEASVAGGIPVAASLSWCTAHPYNWDFHETRSLQRQVWL